MVTPDFKFDEDSFQAEILGRSQYDGNTNNFEPDHDFLGNS